MIVVTRLGERKEGEKNNEPILFFSLFPPFFLVPNFVLPTTVAVSSSFCPILFIALIKC